MNTDLPGQPRTTGESTGALAEDLRTRRRRLMQDDLAGVAVRLFLVHGYDAVSVDDIAAAAGMSQRSFFRYFATKDEVLRRYWRSMTSALVAAFRTRPDTDDPAGALRSALRTTAHVEPAHRARIHALGRLLIETPEVWSRMLGDSFLDEGVAHELARRRGERPDALAPTALATAIVGAATAGWTAWLRSAGDADPAESVLAAVEVAVPTGVVRDSVVAHHSTS